MRAVLSEIPNNMSRKVFNVYVELHLHAVTCPGVWLCQNGEVAVQVSMLGTTVRTTHLSPVFPLLYHEKFIFQKTFASLRYLTDLHNRLSKEIFSADLVQSKDNDDVENLLAKFESSVLDLLYPSPQDRGLICGVDVDLLMERTEHFPGIIAPKIEVSTKTTIEEVLRNVTTMKENLCLINPKTLSSKSMSPTKRRPRVKKVCHSLHSCPKTSKKRGNISTVVRSPCQRCVTSKHPRTPHKSVINDTKMFSASRSKRRECGCGPLKASPTQPLDWEESPHFPGRRLFHEQLTTLYDQDLSDKDEDAEEEIVVQGCKCRCDDVKEHLTGVCSVCSVYKSYFPSPVLPVVRCQAYDEGASHYKNCDEVSHHHRKHHDSHHLHRLKGGQESHHQSNHIEVSHKESGTTTTSDGKTSRKSHKCENSTACPIKCDCCAPKEKVDKCVSTVTPPHHSSFIKHSTAPQRLSSSSTTEEMVHPTHCNCPHISRNQIRQKTEDATADTLGFSRNPRVSLLTEKEKQNILKSGDLGARWADVSKEKMNPKRGDSTTSNYSGQFYQSLERFYRKLHERYQNKAMLENIAV